MAHMCQPRRCFSNEDGRGTVGLWNIQELQRLNARPPASSPGASVAEAGAASAAAPAAVAAAVVVAAAGPYVGAADSIAAPLRRLDAMGPPVATAVLRLLMRYCLRMLLALAELGRNMGC